MNGDALGALGFAGVVGWLGALVAAHAHAARAGRFPGVRLSSWPCWVSEAPRLNGATWGWRGFGCLRSVLQQAPSAPCC